MKYNMSWTLKDGNRVKNQIYTADKVSKILADLETWGAYDIELKSIEGDEEKKHDRKCTD